MNLLTVKAMFLLGAIATVCFAGVEPSPFLPIWNIIIRIFGF